MGEETVEKTTELSWYELIKKLATATIDLTAAYYNIHNKAVNKEEITAKDFFKAEDQFTNRIAEVTIQSELLYNTGITNFYKVDKEEIFTLDNLHKNSLKIPTINNTEPLEDAFRRQLTYAPHKDLSLPENVKTPEELISALLAKNAGIAIGDLHAYSAALPFIYDNIRTFKKAGVKTIYTELDEPSFLDLSGGSIKELQTMINSRPPETIQKSREKNAKLYGIPESNDRFGEFLKLFLTAKENDIEIINIDKKGYARDFEANLSMKHRNASTNYTWSENIIDDRKNKLPSDKYIVLAGAGHFTDIYNTKGLVDDRLGIPVIDFDNRSLNIKSPILRGESSNSADFYLPAGECYPDRKLAAKAADYNDIASASEPTARNKFRKLASQYNNEFDSRLKLVCEPAHDADSKHPTMVKVSKNIETELNK